MKLVPPSPQGWRRLQDARGEHQGSSRESVDKADEAGEAEEEVE